MRLLILTATALLVGAVAVSTVPHPDAPPPAHTGGFGEKTCVDCHVDGGPFNGARSLEFRAEGPWRPKRESPIQLILRSTGMVRSGFQLSIRHPDGTQAGTFSAPDDRVQVIEMDGIQYASHSGSGSWAVGDSATWDLRWTAPPDGDSLLVHVAANAGGGDNSPLGDSVFVRTFTLTRLR